MTTPNDANEPSLASAGSHAECQLERVAEIVHCAMAWYREGTTKKWQGGNSYAEDRARLAARRIARILKPALTDAEREALKKVLRRVREDYFAGRFADSVEVAAVIDGLLERTK